MNYFIYCMFLVLPFELAFSNDFSDEALIVKINKAGFSVLEPVLKEIALKDLKSVPLPNYNAEKFGWSSQASGLKLSIDFERVVAIPLENKMAMRIGLKNIEVEIENFGISYNYATWFDTECWDTYFQISGKTPTYLDLNLKLNIINGVLKTSFEDVNFFIDEDNYHTKGPSYCSGTFRGFVEKVLPFILSKAKSLVEDQVRSQILKSIPKIEAAANDAITKIAEFKLGKIPGFPDKTLLIHPKPTKVLISKGELMFAYDFTAELIKNRKEFPGINRLISGHKTKYATIMLNSNIANRLLNTIIPSGTDYIELTDSLLPGIGEYFTTLYMSNIWPDLNVIPLTNNNIRTFVRLSKTPSINSDNTTQSINIDIHELEIRTMVQLDNQWVDYYNLSLNVNGSATMVIIRNQILGNILPNLEYSFHGEWANSYTPQITWVEDDVLDMILSTIKDFADIADPLFSFSIPPLKLGSTQVDIVTPRVVGNYIEIDVVSHN